MGYPRSELEHIRREPTGFDNTSLTSISNSKWFALRHIEHVMTSHDGLRIRLEFFSEVCVTEEYLRE